ncbi:uncharacterized protein MELLADRAFT_94232 [Melampsora larici-populina 98AG31]|uniref:DM34 domain-containing protein n=1 Tax=Melampsora larici-populina (strain 98AG31 / pathotype 3-4-7) TaxID=747676 RepID=F4S6Z0_MELLP|nr:uncharacterized protein MELLADRAFT_94232 [Melampsora larici-populina 98AG31]EGF99598.1 hypothetical protein MELLADRAFT_94232 [Melampsora larici-populina 98AG31]
MDDCPKLKLFSPPDLGILEIGDIGTDQLRGIFCLTYAGDASISLQTRIRANPL